MTHRVTDERYGRLKRRLDEVARRVDEGTVPYESAMLRLQKIIEGEDFPMNNMFIPPAAQLDLVRQRNKERSWGFTDKDFAALGQPPASPEGNLSEVVLDVSLDTVQQTFEEAWSLAASVQPNFWRWSEINSDPDHLRLHPGITHERGLRWRIIDVAPNWDRKQGVCPTDVRNPETSPHSAILWAASYFPKWVQAMDGKKVPLVWILGYQLTIAGCERWSHVPVLSWNRIGRKVGLNAFDDRDRDPCWAVPGFRE